MKKITCLICTLFLLLAASAVPSALAMETDYAGNWVCMYVDMGDGKLQTEYQGMILQENISFDLRSDGTVLLNSFGMQQEGAWQPTGAGISIFADNTLVAFTYADEQLVNTDEGVTMYFIRSESGPKQGGFNTLVNLSGSGTKPDVEYAGVWKALSYEASGVPYDIAMFFPEGITITLLDGGSGFVQLTPQYAEPFTWSETDGVLSVNGSNFLYDPVWDAETGTLSLCYASDIIRITFEKTDEAADVPADTGALPQTYTCDFFSVSFPENWEQNEYNVYNWDNYYSAQYDLNDESGWASSSVRVVASVEEVANHRIELDTLLGYAKAEGKNTLDELVIDGITFQGTVYGDYWKYAEYTARVPEASMTLSIQVSSPEAIVDVLTAIYQSIDFTFSIPDPPLSDPPLPEDGVAYQPAAAAATIGAYELQAAWLPADSSIVTNDAYNGSIAAIGDTVFVLTGKQLRQYTRDGNQLVSTGDPLQLSTDFRFLSASWDGTLYITDGYYQAMSLKDAAPQEFELDGYLAMQPEGQWGLCYWASSDVKRIAFTQDGMASKPWILTKLDDDTARQGRFSSVQYITITADRIFVAGSDAQSDNATRIAMYDLDGNELATFGGVGWSDESAFGSVAGIVQTGNGIIVLDGYYQDFKLFSMDGTFLGAADCDDLLGTDYPWPLVMTPSENGALALLSQEREDKSAVELLVFEITGF